MRRKNQPSTDRVRRRSFPRLEELEPRVVPAKLVSATTLIYQDVDGDNVTVVLSKGGLTTNNANNVFTFSSGPGAVNGSTTIPEQLQEIDLTALSTSANGTGVKVTAARSPTTHGDGFANVGFITAANINLGSVSIKGDLGKIVAGTATGTTSSLASLTVQSMGRFGTTTQPPGGDLQSSIARSIGTVTIKSDLDGATISVGASIGTLTIGGSLLGGAGTNSGSVQSQGNIGTVSIGGNIEGGAGLLSGVVYSVTGQIGSLKVGGSILGGSGPADDVNGNGSLLLGAGSVISKLNLGHVTIGGDIVGGSGDGSGSLVSVSGTIQSTVAGVVVGVSVGGNLQGGSGNQSGQISSTSDMGPVKIGRSIIGGSQANTGLVSCGGNLGAVTVGGDVRGSAFPDTGVIGSGKNGKIASVKIGGSLIGGTDFTGEVSSGSDIGSISIDGDLVGSSGGNSGGIDGGGNIGTVFVGGSLFGGTGGDTGEILSGPSGNIGFITVNGSLYGNSGGFSGDIDAGGNIAAARIGQSLIGGTGGDSGEIFSTGNMGSLTIGGDLVGGSGGDSGAIFCSGNLAGIMVAGSLLGGDGGDTGEIFVDGAAGAVTVGGDVQGGGGGSSGDITVTGNLGAVTIKGNLVGGSISGSGAVSLSHSGYVTGQRIASLVVGGSIVAGSNTSTNGATLTNSGAVQAVNDIGPITVKGSLEGNSTNPVFITARGQATVSPKATVDLAIASLTVNGRVEMADILAGYDTSGNAVNGNASIGAVKVGLDWIASNIAAGVETGDSSMNFGKATDHEVLPESNPDLISQIASIVIGGQVLGTPTVTTDHFGLDAEQIGSFSVGGTSYALKPGPHNDGLQPVGATGDVDLFEAL